MPGARVPGAWWLLGSTLYKARQSHTPAVLQGIRGRSNISLLGRMRAGYLVVLSALLVTKAAAGDKEDCETALSVAATVCGRLPTSIGNSVRLNWPHLTGES